MYIVKIWTSTLLKTQTITADYWSFKKIFKNLKVIEYAFNFKL